MLLPFVTTLAFSLLTTFQDPLGKVLWAYKGAPVASHAFSLEDRYANTFVNDVFKDNILLSLFILRRGMPAQPIDWSEVRKPFQFTFELKPQETFAFHDSVLVNYQNQKLKILPAHFNAQEGFKSDGYLFGDGVCHLASLINWAARDAGLKVESPVAHDFANIPEIPREFGVSIYSRAEVSADTARQNLYITNNKKHSARFMFTYDGQVLKVEIFEASK